jgi:predicted transcriptional regulator
LNDHAALDRSDPDAQLSPILLVSRDVAFVLDYYDSSSMKRRTMVDVAALGPLEMRVLGLLDRRVPMAGAEVREKLAAQGTELAYTTVMTVLTRLQDKGLARRKRDGNRYLYLASQQSEPVSAGIFTRVKQSLFRTDRTKPILALLDDDDLSAEELRALRKAIDERLKDRKP